MLTVLCSVLLNSRLLKRERDIKIYGTNTTDAPVSPQGEHWSEEWYASDAIATEIWQADTGWYTDWGWQGLAQSHDTSCIAQLDSCNQIEMHKNPMNVILDLGCTKAMGSRQAINALCAASSAYNIHCEFMPTHSFFSFANRKTTVVWVKCRIHFPTTPPCHTDVDLC